MSKLFDAINKARKHGDAPTVIDTKANGAAGSATTHAGAPLSRVATVAPLAGPLPEPRTSAPTRPARQEREREREERRLPERHDSPEEHMVSLVDPHSFEAEQFRSLRHIVEQRQREGALRIVAVTSPAEGDGKSLVSVNLAGALAQNKDARVLVVDADLRAPAIDHCLGLRGSSAGLAGAVASETLDLEDVAIVRSAYNLSVLPAGKPPSSPYEVLKSERFTSLLAEARGRYDFIVIDTPPILTFPDTRIIETHVDGLLLVVGANKTPRKMVEEAVESIPENKLLGLVFNGEDEPKRYSASTYYARARARRSSRGWGKSKR